MTKATDKQSVVLSIGAPSRTGIDANDLITQSFVAEDFPLQVKVTNKVGHDLVFPRRCHLKPVFDVENCSEIITVASIDSMQRFATDIEAIAELNQAVELLTLEADVIREVLPVKSDTVKTPKGG